MLPSVSSPPAISVATGLGQRNQLPSKKSPKLTAWHALPSLAGDSGCGKGLLLTPTVSQYLPEVPTQSSSSFWILKLKGKIIKIERNREGEVEREGKKEKEGKKERKKERTNEQLGGGGPCL